MATGDVGYVVEVEENNRIFFYEYNSHQYSKVDYLFDRNGYEVK